MKINLLFILLIFSTVSILAQENTLEDQFNIVIQKSNNYQEYKVVKKTDLTSLKNNTLSTISQLEKNIEFATKEIKSQNSTISNLNKELEITKQDLKNSQEKESGIQFMGFMTTKSSYNLGMFSMIGFLLVAIMILFIKFRSSNSITKSTRVKLLETEQELESFRHRSIEKEQQLRRKLQDEINKNKV